MQMEMYMRESKISIRRKEKMFSPPIQGFQKTLPLTMNQKYEGKILRWKETG